jgi:serine/threonine protein kinase
LLELARGVAEGVDYMHQCNIVHRDLKAANLLLDAQGEVKVADFGVARVQSMGGVMTAETGTYRWMAPEVVAHQSYDFKCDIFSYGITLWELVTNGAVPYAGYTPLQAAVGVVQKGLRPEIPHGCHQELANAMEMCWKHLPGDRPTAAELESRMRKAITKYNAKQYKSSEGSSSQKRRGEGEQQNSYVEPATPVSQKTGLLAQTLTRLGMSPKAPPRQQQQQPRKGHGR